MNIYPNPADDVLKLDLVESTSGIISITDLNGKIIIMREFDSKTELEYNVGGLKPGYYIVRFYGSKNVMTGSFVKK